MDYWLNSLTQNQSSVDSGVRNCAQVFITKNYCDVLSGSFCQEGISIMKFIVVGITRVFLDTLCKEYRMTTLYETVRRHILVD